MNWNNYDTKYIIKRIIIGFGMLILFSIFTTHKANALISAEYIRRPSYINSSGGGVNPGDFTINGYSGTFTVRNSSGTARAVFSGLGQGKMIFSFAVTNESQPVAIPISAVNIHTTNGNLYTCNIGNNGWYYDNTKQVNVYSAECDVDTSAGGVNSIIFEKPTQYGTTGVIVSELANFVTKDSTSVNVNVNQQQVVDAINNTNQSLINSINNANNQAHQDAQQAHQDSQDIKNTLTNDNVDGANSDLDNFKNSSTFSDSTGLQAILELPLNLVNSLSNTCQPISITIPWLDYTGTIPCMSTIYSQHFNSLYSVVAVVVNAFFIYRILLKIYELVHNAKQPDEDKLEVIDL